MFFPQEYIETWFKNFEKYLMITPQIGPSQGPTNHVSSIKGWILEENKKSALWK